MSEINRNKIAKKAAKVEAKYPNDLVNAALSNECVHSHFYLKQLLEKSENLHSASVISVFLLAHDLCYIYPNIEQNFKYLSKYSCYKLFWRKMILYTEKSQKLFTCKYETSQIYISSILKSCCQL